MMDADGCTHAHRIYVAPGGAGKADLPRRPDGSQRDVKKSAKKTPGNNISGRSVFWGDPASVPELIIAEGIETAAAIAFAFKGPIDGKEIAVAAAITAGGIEAFKPWPAARRVIVAADRNEEKPEGDAGFKRGERAAKRFA